MLNNMRLQVNVGWKCCMNFLKRNQHRYKHIHTKSCLLSAVSSSEARSKRNQLFNEEQERQHKDVGRIEKIEVTYTGSPEDTTLVMNKDISTPFNCAQHISEMLTQRSALALVDDSTPWDMHRPLEASCKLRLLHFRDTDPYLVNRAFWRTCSLLLGGVVERIFKDDIPVLLHSFPSPNVRSGSFLYDVEIGLDSWQPTQDELRLMSGQMVELCRKELKLERLVVHPSLALEMFADNPHKSSQIPDIAEKSHTGNEVILYRLGDHIDISRGPLVGNTGFVGRCTIASVHQLQTNDRLLYRFQGVALPRGFLLNHFAYNILENRAKKLNPGRQPLPAREAVSAA